MVGAARDFTSVDPSILKLEIENGMIKKIKIIIKKRKENRRKVLEDIIPPPPPILISYITYLFSLIEFASNEKSRTITFIVLFLGHEAR